MKSRRFSPFSQRLIDRKQDVIHRFFICLLKKAAALFSKIIPFRRTFPTMRPPSATFAESIAPVAAPAASSARTVLFYFYETCSILSTHMNRMNLLPCRYLATGGDRCDPRRMNAPEWRFLPKGLCPFNPRHSQNRANSALRCFAVCFCS